MSAIIFDFDGLIIDTETAWYEAFKEAMNFYQADLPLSEFAKCIGTDDTALYGYIKEKLGESCNIDDIKKRAYSIHKIKMVEAKAREGVQEYLDEAKALGLKIGLASSSSREWVTHFLRELELLNYFEVIVTRDDVEKVKPAPELYIKALTDLRIDSKNAIAFEDSLNGLTAAVAAGLRCIIVPNPVTETLSFEKHVLRLKSMAEKSLVDVIKHIEDQDNCMLIV
ncbi:HAD family hydrolase [Bacillus sp. JJ1609]|uniref:HAD family hydrolase n=1 Tax=Bacillus sp. JJ1609 TaxID=3122977 RepID=UPI002FFE67B2